MNIQAKVYPNPFSTGFSVEASCETEQQVIFRVLNQSGNLIKMSYWKLLKGTNKMILENLQNLSPGKYGIELKSPGGEVIYSVQLEKQNML